jgi:hypothetical protein
MSNNKKRSQGGQQQQPQVPSLDLEATVSGRLIYVSIQAKLGNKPNGNQLATAFLRKAGGNWIKDRSATTDPITGRAAITLFVGSPGFYDVEVQIGTTKNSTTVEIPKDPAPKCVVHPMRVANAVRFLVTGKPLETIVFYNGKKSSTEQINKNGILELSVSLSNNEEHEILIHAVGPKKRAYRGTFFRYESREVGNNPLYIPISLVLAFFWAMFYLLPSATKAMPIPLVLGLQVIVFTLYVWVATKTKFNNIMALILMILALISFFFAFSQEAGQNPFDWFVGFLFKHSKSLRDLIWYLPKPYTGSGSWVWCLLAPLFVLESIFFVPFFIWDEVVDFTRKQAEKWSQRPFCLDEEEEKPKAVIAASEGEKKGDSRSFLARTWDKFDEAIVAGVGWDLVYKFITTKKH